MTMTKEEIIEEIKNSGDNLFAYSAKEAKTGIDAFSVLLAIKDQAEESEKNLERVISMLGEGLVEKIITYVNDTKTL